MRQKSLIFILLVFLFQITLSGQNTKPDTLLIKYKNGIDSLRAIKNGQKKYQNITYYQDGKIDYVSYRAGLFSLFGSYSYYPNGKKRHRSKEGIFRTLRGREWDENGRITSKSRMHPFGSTSYREVYREKKYNIDGHLIKYEYMRETIACFGGEIKKNIIIEYEENGKVKSKTVRTKKEERRKKD